MTQVDDVSYTWDDSGNLVNDGNFTYGDDAANQLTSVTGGGLTIEYTYNGPSTTLRTGLGQRVAQTVNGVTTNYVLDVAGPLPEVIAAVNGGATTRYLQVGGQLLAQQNVAGQQYAGYDRLGSVRLLVGPDGEPTLAQGFDPFGNVLTHGGLGGSGCIVRILQYQTLTGLTDRLYTGQKVEPGLNLCDYGRAACARPLVNPNLSK